MSASVRVQDNGAARVLAMGRGRAKIARVGVLEADGAKAYEGKGSVITVGMVARWAEFGIGQPERSWLRGTIAAHRGEIEARIRAEVQAMLPAARGGVARPEEQAVARVGAFVVGLIQQRIAAGIPPENAESTIAAKGSSTPLINTGQLRSSITFQVQDA